MKTAAVMIRWGREERERRARQRRRRDLISSPIPLHLTHFLHSSVIAPPPPPPSHFRSFRYSLTENLITVHAPEIVCSLHFPSQSHLPAFPKALPPVSSFEKYDYYNFYESSFRFCSFCSLCFHFFQFFIWK